MGSLVLRTSTELIYVYSIKKIKTVRFGLRGSHDDCVNLGAFLLMCCLKNSSVFFLIHYFVSNKKLVSLLRHRSLISTSWRPDLWIISLISWIHVLIFLKYVWIFWSIKDLIYHCSWLPLYYLKCRKFYWSGLSVHMIVWPGKVAGINRK